MSNFFHGNIFFVFRKSFKARIILIYTIVWIGLMTIAGSIVYHFISKSMEKAIGEQIVTIGGLIARQVSERLPDGLQPNMSGSPQVFPDSLKYFLSGEIIQNLTILNSNGTIQMDAVGEAIPGFKSPLFTPDIVNSLLNGGVALLPIQSGDFGVLHQSLFMPLKKGFVLQVDANPKYLETLSMFRNLFLLVGVSGLLVSAIVGAWISRNVLIPLESVMELARKVAEGHYPANPFPKTQREDELGKLQISLLEMADQIKAREEELSTLRLKAEEETEKMKEVAGGIAHEVRNPLGIINAEVEWIESKSRDFPQILEPAQKIKEQVKDLNYLVARFLEYGRPLRLNHDVVPPKNLLNGLVEAVSVQSEKQGVKIEKDDQPCGLIRADSILLSGCLYNLGLNSLQAMPNGGVLTLRLHEEGSWAVFEVEDTGSGIAPENLSRIFKPFFSTKPNGTGLGLAFVQKVIQAHGGRIECSNKPSDGGSRGEVTVDKGAQFKIYIPLFKDQA